jgi:hypothetical protein
MTIARRAQHGQLETVMVKIGKSVRISHIWGIAIWKRAGIFKPAPEKRVTLAAQ